VVYCPSECELIPLATVNSPSECAWFLRASVSLPSACDACPSADVE